MIIEYERQNNKILSWHTKLFSRFFTLSFSAFNTFAGSYKYDKWIRDKGFCVEFKSIFSVTFFYHGMYNSVPSKTDRAMGWRNKAQQQK